MEKNKAGKSVWKPRDEAAVLNRLVREDFIEKVTSEQRLWGAGFREKHSR